MQLNGVSNKLDERVIKLHEKNVNKGKKFTNRLTWHWKTESAIESNKKYEGSMAKEDIIWWNKVKEEHGIESISNSKLYKQAQFKKDE